MADSNAPTPTPHDRVPAGTYRGRPELERMLAELRQAPTVDRRELVRRAAGNVLVWLEQAESILARDPQLTVELPPGVGGLTNREAATSALDRAAKTLAGLVSCAAYPATLRAIRGAIVPEPGQPVAERERQQRNRAALARQAAAIVAGCLVGFEDVSGLEGLTVQALGLDGVTAPPVAPTPARSAPERHFRPLRGAIGGPFNRERMLHWVVVLWNASRVPPSSPDYAEAQATKREALLALAYLERTHGTELSYGVVVAMPGGPE